MKVLIATDGSETGQSAVAETASRCWHEGTEIKIIYVVEIPFAPMPNSLGMASDIEMQDVLLKQATEKGAEVLAQAVEIFGQKSSSKVRLTSEVVTSAYINSAQQTIVDEAENFGADLIVLGSRGLNTWKRLLLGSVSQSVALHAHCSVEIVRHRTK